MTPLNPPPKYRRARRLVCSMRFSAVTAAALAGFGPASAMDIDVGSSDVKVR